MSLHPCLLVAVALIAVGCGRSSLDTFDDDAAGGLDGGAACSSDDECSDGLFCNGQERCIESRCVDGAPIDCADDVDCTVERCVEATRSCEVRPEPSRCPSGARCVLGVGCAPAGCADDRECDDGRVCNGVERCVDGGCVPGDPLRCPGDGVACSVEECVEAAGGCVSTPVHARCSDGLFCNGEERCVLGAGCAPGAPVGCDDGIACTLDRCDEARRACVSLPVDGDGDGELARACGGRDCDDTDPRIGPSAPELCDDGVDNDCDGLVDCADPDCTREPSCCIPRQEICDNGVDDDCDGLADCSDSLSCSLHPACRTCTPEVCGDGVDNDCDGAIDCADPDCFADPACIGCVPRPERCASGRDEDCDGLVDCADPDCASDPVCGADCAPSERGASCRNGRDDDCDGAVDCDDEDCAGTLLCAFCLPFELCGTGFDEDCNGLADCDDPACADNPECG